ncbi:hypothetical protein [Brachyspira hyodysenteriae]|nr:hypothetical protein [Brachyspira hyodysenteriae]MCZ9889019.1 hypothetical protein [Brachyspira hyodysenteriae]
MEKLTATFEGQSQQFAEKFDLVLGSIGQSNNSVSYKSFNGRI